MSSSRAHVSTDTKRVFMKLISIQHKI